MPTRPPVHRPSFATQRHAEQARAEQRRAYDRARQDEKNAIYDADWRRLRKAFLAEHPLCCFCARKGVLTAATVVDHIIAVRDDPSRRLDPTNLRSACKPCHDRRTATEQGFARRKR